MVEVKPFRDPLFWLLVAGAGVLRVGYVVVFKRSQPLSGDQIYYSAQAEMIARGRWFEHPFESGSYAADHVPLTALAVSPVSWLPDSVFWQRMLMAVYGTVAVAAIGVLAWHLLGRRIGLIAIFVAAVYANLWMNDGLVMAETLAVLGVVAVLWFTYKVQASPRTLNLIGLGTAVALATLARAELLLLLVLVALPMVVLSNCERPRKRRLADAALVVLIAGLVLSPWVARNLVRFENPVVLSSQDGLTLVGANCADSYFRPGIGFWSLDCGLSVAVEPNWDQSQRSAAMRVEAIEFVTANLDRTPKVVLARLGRGFSVWQPDAMAHLNLGEGREVMSSRIGYIQFWVLVPFAVVGFLRWPVGRSRWPLLATASLSLITIVAFYGIPRFRIAAEVAIVVAAAVAIDRAQATVFRTRGVHLAGATPAGAPSDD